MTVTVSLDADVAAAVTRLVEAGVERDAAINQLIRDGLASGRSAARSDSQDS